MEFRLKFEFIELDNLLKVLDLATDGIEAKHSIQEGLVKVNGQIEKRVRCKLRPGDSVEFRQQQVSIIK